MSTWLRYFSFWRRDARLDARDEIGFHLEMRVADLQSRGLSLEEARRQAEHEFGDARGVVAEVARIDQRMMRREARAEWWQDFARDVRVAWRSLRHSPAFTITAVLCAALGIGVTGTIVSAAHAILVRPLPYRDADQLVAIYGENTVRGYRNSNISWADYVSWRDENRAFSAIGMWSWNTQTLSDDGSEAERVAGAEVTPNLFRLLGVRPARGRNFLDEEGVMGGNRVAILSDNLWRRRYGADTAIVGKTIRVDGRGFTVVGVMRPGFNFPERGEMWIPFVTNPANERRGNRQYAGAIGRIKPNVSVAQARQDLHRIDAELQKQFPNESFGWRADVVELREDLVGNLRQPLKVFLWSVGLVLLLVCANLANLLLARGAIRSQEIAVRSALGASRARLTRQLMTESLLIALLGGVAGIAIAWWGVRLLRLAFPEQTPPFFITLDLDTTALAFIFSIAIVTGLLFGTFPALRGTRVDLNTALRDGARGGSGLARSRLRGALVIGEVALSVMLMIGALLLVRSYRNLHGTDLGFDEHGILSARITLPRTSYPNRAANLAFYDRLLERLRAIPGVTHVASAEGIPFSGWDVQASVAIEGAPRAKPGESVVAHLQVMTPEFLRTIGVPLIRGRWLTAADRDSLAPVMVVNERFVAAVFPNQDPIGRRISVAGLPYAAIVGVVGDHRHYRLPQPMGPAAYYSFATWPPRTQFVVLRTSQADPRQLVPALRSVVREMDPSLALYQIQTFEEVVSRSLWRQRLQGNVLSIFAVLALVLACIGLYGVISYTVAQRTRELGVRVALGASRRNVAMLVFGQSGKLVLAGVGAGLVGAYFGVGVLRTLLYGVEATDPATFASVPALLAVIALIAAVVPARRAARVNPIIAMRAE